MEQHPTGANDRRLAGQEIFCILLNKTFIATFSRPPKTRSYFEPIQHSPYTKFLLLQYQ
jgi:hypothetical protein